VVEKPPSEAQNPPMADRASQSIYLGLGVVGLALLAFVMFRYLGGWRLALMNRKQQIRSLIFWLAVVVTAVAVYFYAQAQIPAD
jgi:uncharacterized membrane protein SirB2